MKVLIRLYPRAWRARYGDELASLVAAERPTLRLALDLIAGAIDARVNRQPLPGDAGSSDHRGVAMRQAILHCEPVHVTRAESLRSAAVMIGATVLLAGVSLALKSWFGKTPLVEAFMTSTFPLAFLVGVSGTYFKPYTRSARAIIIGTVALLVFLISLTAAMVN